MEFLKISSKSQAKSVAGAIAGIVREKKNVEAHAIGAGAVNQTVKSIAIAREYLLIDDIDLICIPSFIEIEIDNENKTAIKFLIEER